MIDTPLLYVGLAETQLVSAVSRSGPVQSLCDGQFVIVPGAVLGVITLGASANASSLDSPSIVTWRPPRLGYGGASPYPWFPDSARNLTPPARHHLFLRTREASLYLYVGAAHLGSYGGPYTSPGAVFYLDSVLPRTVWLELGGYSGWSVEFNHEQHLVAAGDTEVFATLVAHLADEPFGHLVMTRYEQGSLHVYTNPSRAWLMYLREPADSGLYLSRLDLESGLPEERFRCGCGIDLEFPYLQTATHAEAFGIARAFFSTGQLPQRESWCES